MIASYNLPDRPLFFNYSYTRFGHSSDKNQDILLTGIENLDLKNKTIILDGHFVLIQNNEIKHLPLSTFSSLNISKVILLHDQPEKILQRINSRDNISNFTVELIDEMQKNEIKYAEEVTQLLNIELEKIKVIERTSKTPKK